MQKREKKKKKVKKTKLRVLRRKVTVHPAVDHETSMVRMHTWGTRNIRAPILKGMKNRMSQMVVKDNVFNIKHSLIHVLQKIILQVRSSRNTVI